MSEFFGTYNDSKQGKGLSEDEPKKRGFFSYFEILFRHFFRIFIINVLYVLLSIPMYVLIFFISTYLTTWSATVSGLTISAESVSTISIIGLFASLAMLIICGSGPVSSAMSYMLTSFVNREYYWAWSDFTDTLKKDLKRGFIVYFLNIIALILLIVGYNFYSHILTGIIGFIFKSLVTIFMLFFVIMQLYVYQIMARYELSVKDIYKHAATLSFIKLPHNVIVALILAILLYGVFRVTMSYPLVGFLFLLMFFYSFFEYTKIFMTNSVVKCNIHLLENEE